MDAADENSSDKKQIGDALGWMGDHGQISYEELQKLAAAGTPEATERLRQLADDNNIGYDGTTDLAELAEKIYSAMEKDTNDGVE